MNYWKEEKFKNQTLYYWNNIDIPIEIKEILNKGPNYISDQNNYQTLIKDINHIINNIQKRTNKIFENNINKFHFFEYNKLK